MFNTNQNTLPFNNNIAHERFASIGLPSHRQKNLTISPRTRSVDIDMKSRTPELLRAQDAENYTVAKPKSSPDMKEMAINSSDPYNLSALHEKTGPISFAHAFRSKNMAIQRAMSIDDKPKTTDLDESLKPESMDTTASNYGYPYNLSTTNRENNSNEKPFNFMRMADNLSPPKSRLDKDLDKLLNPKLFAKLNETPSLHIDTSEMPRNDSITEKESNVPTLITKAPRFLRPSSLPLKPETFTQKKHHGITPTSNTFALISPETPRPSKHCVQLYLNGHAYTYLGLKCSTKTFYCTVNRPQPVHFTNQHKLSIYSNWQTCAENNPHPLGFKPKEAMALYDSRQRQQQGQYGSKYTTANRVQFTTLHSQSVQLSQAETTISDRRKLDGIQSIIDENAATVAAAAAAVPGTSSMGACSSGPSSSLLSSTSSAQIQSEPVPGGYKSNEDYTYIRGRGRGRYVCSECGIRCKKPSMLKKHVRTHSDVRPYTCRRCKFRYSRYYEIREIQKREIFKNFA